MSSSAPLPEEAHALKHELAREVLRSAGTLRLRVTGLSMLPTLWPGDVLTIERTRSEEIREGDIVLFNTTRQFVAHRVVTKTGAREDLTIHTQGDAVSRLDSPLSRGDLLGRVSFILRNGRSIEPRKTLRTSERAVATLLQRSKFAARVVVKMHGMRRASQVPTSQVQISHNRAVSCQP
jgi:signal peptidase I